jgi:hypothetical protein
LHRMESLSRRQRRPTLILGEGLLWPKKALAINMVLTP